MDRTPTKNHNIERITFSPAIGNDHFKNTHHNNNDQSSQYPPTSLMNWKRKRTKLSKMCNHQNILERGTLRNANNFLHLNSLWSIWYGIILTLFQGYLALHGTYRFLGCSLISWKSEPVTELNLQVLLSGVVFILLPLFFISAVFKIGNFANDGVKLTTGVYWCDCSLQNGTNFLRKFAGNNFLHTLAVHGGPTSSFIHIVVALCLLLPRLLLEAGIIENGFLPLENIWQTELDFLKIYRQKLPSITITNLEIYRNSSRLDLNFNENDVEYYNTSMFTDVTAIIPTENEFNSSESYLRGLFAMDSFNDPSSYNLNHVSKSMKNENISKILHNILYNAVAKTRNNQDNYTTSNKFETKSQDIDYKNIPEMQLFDMEKNFSSFEFEPNASIVLDWSTVPPYFPLTLNSTRQVNLNESSIDIIKNDTKSLTNSVIDYIDFNINFMNTTPTSLLEPITKEVTSSTPEISLSTDLKEITTLMESTLYYSDNRQHKTKNYFHGKVLRKKHKGYKNRHRHAKQQLQQQQQLLPVYENSTNGTMIFEYTADGVKSVTIKSLINNKTSTSKDSNIHIVRTEKLPEIVPSTPITSDSKIIAIKTKLLKRLKRELITHIRNIFKEIKSSAEYWTTTTERSSTNNLNKNEVYENKTNILAGFAGYLQLLFGIERAIDVDVFNHYPSAEFMNLLIALTVWCIRYPSVFWVTSKSFATVFSLQITASVFDIVFSYAGISILYKFQMYSQFQFVTSPKLLLNRTIILLLFLLIVLLNLTSSMIMYLHGYVRFSAKMRERSIISLKSNDIWIYLAHLLSCCYIFLLAIVKAPILNDFSAIYHQRADRLVFISALTSVLYLLLWIMIWLCLSVKRDWKFKLGSVNVYNVLDKGLPQQQRQVSCHNRINLPNDSTTRRFQASSNNSENSYITSKLNNCERSCDLEAEFSDNCSKVSVKNDNDITSSTKSKDINLKKQSQRYDVNNIDPGNYCEKNENNSALLKVTFKGIQYISNSELSRHSMDQITDCLPHHNNIKRNSVYSATNFMITSHSNSDNDNDDGEYETLRSDNVTKMIAKNFQKEQNNISNNSDIRRYYVNKHRNASSLTSHEINSMIIETHNNFQTQNNGHISLPITDDNVSEEGKLLAYVRDESITYASANEVEPPLPPPPTPPPPPAFPANLNITANVYPRNHTEDFSELIVANNEDNTYSSLNPVTVTVHTYDAHINFNSSTRYFRCNEVNAPQELLTPRSETTSMETSSTTSPPDRPSSESSSGIHSGEERENEVSIRPRAFTKSIVKLQPPSIQEEPYDRCTNMQMSSFITNSIGTNASSTLPLQRSFIDHQMDYSQHCSTMPLP